jgi:hypothetical protein
MPLPLWAGMALGGAALGLAKNEFIDKPRAERMGQAEAAKTYYSPWTGMQGQTVMPPSAADAAMKWGVTGGLMGASMPAAKGAATTTGGSEILADPTAQNTTNWTALSQQPNQMSPMNRNAMIGSTFLRNPQSQQYGYGMNAPF